MNNLDNPNGDDDSSNRDEAKGKSKPTKPDSVLIHLNELRNLRAVAEDNDIIDHPEVSWIPRFDQDIARMYGERLTATKTNDNMTYMWIQDPTLMKEYQEWYPRAYNLMLELDLITQVIERVASHHKAKGTGWFPPKLWNGRLKKVSEYSESEREAHEKFKALQKSPAKAGEDGGERMPTLQSYMKKWRRRDLASTGSDYVQICEPGHPGYLAALAHRWIDMAAVENTESRASRKRDVESEAFELVVRKADSLWIEYKQRPINEEDLPVTVEPDYSVYDIILSGDKEKQDELVRKFDRDYGHINGLSKVDMDLGMATDTNINTGEMDPFLPHLPMGPAVEMVQQTSESEHREAKDLNEPDMDLDTDTNARESHPSSTDLPMNSALGMVHKAAELGHREVSSFNEANMDLGTDTNASESYSSSPNIPVD